MVPLLRSTTLDAVDGVRHGFTRRQGGVSPAPRDSLHLALRDGDDPDDVTENWRRATAALGTTADRVALVHQVHGDAVRVVNAPTWPLAVAGEADGLITTTPGVVLAVRVADCVPVLIAGPRGVAAVHAGWRGLVAGVLPAAVRALRARLGAVPLVAAVGPRAGVDAYETGEGVVDALVEAGLPRARISARGPAGRLHTDLGAAARLQLEAAGVDEVDVARACTISDRRFFSHRRDGAETGRQAALVMLAVDA